MKLRAKLFLFLLPPLLGGALAIHYFTGRAVCDTLHEELAAAAEAGAGRVLAAAGPDFAAARETQLLPFLYELAAALNASYAYYTDGAGAVAAHTNVALKGTRLPPLFRRRDLQSGAVYGEAGAGHEAPLELRLPVYARPDHSPEELALLGPGRGREALGTLAIGLPLAQARSTERGIARKNALVLAAVMAAVLAAAFLLTGLILRPVRQLAAATERVRRGDYGAEVPATAADEIGDLARSFNAMSQTLSGTIVSRNYLDAVMDSLPDMLIVTDMDGRIARANRAARTALGGAGSQLEGRALADFFTAERPGGGWLDALREAGGLRERETQLAAAAGPVPATVSASYILDNDGLRTGVVAVLRDITLRKRYEAEIARSNEELQRFAFVASHDLQEPLRTISSYIQLLEHKYRAALGPEAERHAAFITGAAARMRALVRDLLDYSKIDHSPRLEEVDSDEALDYVLAVLQDSLAEAGAEVSRGDLPVLKADRTHLERLFQNLVSNALKFRDTRRPEVRVEARRETGAWVFCVSDNGAGIEPGHGARLFKLFGRLHGKGVDGSGIGLASCKKIVEFYGGRIWFESEPGKGSRFFFSLPDQDGAAA